MISFSKKVNPLGPRKSGNPGVIAEAESGDTKYPPAKAYARGGGIRKSPKTNGLERIPGDVPNVRMDRPRRKGGWIDAATENKGGLHRSLGVPEGEKIPAAKVKAATKSDNPKVAKQARLAETLKKLKD